MGVGLAPARQSGNIHSSKNKLTHRVKVPCDHRISLILQASMCFSLLLFFLLVSFSCHRLAAVFL